MDFLGTVLGALLAGVIIGPLARLVTPGKQDIGIFSTIVAGAVGALVGGLIAQFIGVDDTAGIDWIKFAIQVACGAAAVAGFLALKSR